MQLDFFEFRMRSDHFGTHLDRFALKNCADSAEYQPDWSSSVRFCNFDSFEDIRKYLRVFEADSTNTDPFVQSRLKPAWRAPRAENLLQMELSVSSWLKLAWRASRAENLVTITLSVQFSRWQAAIRVLKKVA